MQHALDFLFADGQMKSEHAGGHQRRKMLAVEDNAEVKSLIEAAEFKYADGISVVRSIRKSFQTLMCLAWRVLTFGSGLWSAQALKARRYF